MTSLGFQKEVEYLYSGSEDGEIERKLCYIINCLQKGYIDNLYIYYV